MESENKKKLLIFHPIIAPYRIDFFNHLSQYYNVKFCMFHRNMIDQKFDYDKISQLFEFTPIILDQFYKLPFFQIRKHIISTIQKFNPDIVLVPECGYTSIIVFFYKVLSKKKYKIISMIDDSYDMIINNNQFSKKHKWGEKILIPVFNNVISVDPNVTAFFQKKYKKGLFFPIIQDEKRIKKLYEQALPISQKYINQYNLNNKKVILFVGRLVDIKNVNFVINAFNKLAPQNTCFVIVGSGDTEKKLKILTQNNPNIIFTGRLEGKLLYAWYNIAELFILPSIQEPFGAVTNEALIGGCFSLISNKAGSSCLIKNGINGYTFNPYNEQEFIKLLYNSLKKVPLRTYPLTLRPSKELNIFAEQINILVNQI